MSQYFRKLKAKWRDPRCRSIGGGRVFLGSDDAVGLKCARFDAHLDNCKCKKERRDRQRNRRIERLALRGFPVTAIIIDELFGPDDPVGKEVFDILFGPGQPVPSPRKL